MSLDNDKLQERLRQYDAALKKARAAYNQAETELTELRNRPAPTPDAQTPDVDVEGYQTAIEQQKSQIAQLQGQLEQLNNFRSNATEQNEALTAQIQTLTDENAKLNSQLANQRQDGGADSANLQTELAQKSSKLNELQQIFNSTQSENQRLQNLAKQLQSQLLTAQAEAQAAPAQIETTTPDPIVETTPTPIVETPVQPTSQFVSNRNYETGELSVENDQLLAFNEEVQEENELLKQRILELEGNAETLAVNKTDLESDAALGVGGLVSTEPGESKFAIMRWLLPFLGIGLAIGLYVFLTEENEIGAQAASRMITDRDDDRTDHRT